MGRFVVGPVSRPAKVSIASDPAIEASARSQPAKAPGASTANHRRRLSPARCVPARSRPTHLWEAERGANCIAGGRRKTTCLRDAPEGEAGGRGRRTFVPQEDEGRPEDAHFKNTIGMV